MPLLVVLFLFSPAAPAQSQFDPHDLSGYWLSTQGGHTLGTKAPTLTPEGAAALVQRVKEMRSCCDLQIEISGVHTDLLKRYSLPIGRSVAKSIAKWKGAQLFGFLVEFICTEGGHIYELTDEGESLLKGFGVDIRSIRKRVENQRKRKLFELTQNAATNH